MKSFLIAFAIFLVCSQIDLSLAGAKKIAPPPPEVFSKITAVNAKTNEVTIIFRKGPTVLAKKPTTYTIDSLTTITINHVPGKFAEIHVGMFVQGTTERDDHTLDNITLETTAPAQSN